MKPFFINDKEKWKPMVEKVIAVFVLFSPISKIVNF